MTSVPHSGAKSVTPGGSVAGHTPEPWFTEYRLTKRGGYSQEVFDAEGEVIATAAWFPVKLNDTTTTTNREANARLIAAAPEHHTVALDLDRLMLVIESAVRFSDPGNLPAVRAMLFANRAAITKATAGETRNAEPIHRRDGDAS